jgi:Castor and Pollux, part of voltage-gated ion channel/Calcium-activated potassium channel slowpoke-like RCK domain
MSRKYGQGAYGGGKETKNSNNRTFGKVFKYYFDNALAKNSNFLIFIILIAFLLGFIMTSVEYSLETIDKESSFNDNWWNSFASVLKIQAKGENWAARFIKFLYWSFSIMVSGFVIGFLSSKISALTKNLNKGKSNIIKRDHILIIGWSNNIFAILKELNIANESDKSTVVVIFSEIPNEEMQDRLKTVNKSLKSMRIVTRSGNTTNPDELKITNPNQARSIIVLNNEEKNDPKVVTATLALCSILENKEISIIVSIIHSRYAEAIKKIRNFDIIPVLAENVISNVTAQACRERGLGLVIVDFLDFDGDELYYKEVPELKGKTYGEALLSFEKSSLIGLVSHDGALTMSPAADHVILDDQDLILVAEDDSTIHYQSAIKINEITTPAEYSGKIDPNKMLFVGWSATGLEIFNSMAGFLPPGSEIDIIYIKDFVNDDNLSERFDGLDITVKYQGTDDQMFDIEDVISKNDYEDIIVLGYTDELSAEEADTLTLLKALQLDSAAERTGKEFRTITQLLNSNKADLAKIGSEKELIVSDNLSALLMAQLVENPHLINVFNDLFESQGSSINVHLAEKYIGLGQEVSYAQIVANASKLGESAIGVMLAAEDESDRAEGLQLNPPKSMMVKLNQGDKVIVVSHEG